MGERRGRGIPPSSLHTFLIPFPLFLGEREGKNSEEGGGRGERKSNEEGEEGRGGKKRRGRGGRERRGRGGKERRGRGGKERRGREFYTTVKGWQAIKCHMLSHTTNLQ